MKLIKLFVFVLFIFGLFLSFNYTFAIGETDNMAPTVAVRLSDVSITEAKIISSEGNVFNISFNISNGEGVQAGVQYGVKLFKEAVGGSPSYIVDEYIYPEVLSLAQNSFIKKEITYTAPALFDGEYILAISGGNSSGYSFGTAILGKVKLTSNLKGVEILPETCKLVSGGKELILNQNTAPITIGGNDKLQLTCTIVNSKNGMVYLTPTFLTTYRNAYGEKVEAIGGDTKTITLDKFEKKTVSLTLPKANEPQAYYVRMSLKDGEMYSNKIGVGYIVEGANVTIRNVFFDKDYYKKGETAKLGMFSTTIGSLDSDLSLKMNMTNKSGKNCGAEVSQILTKEMVNKKIEIPFTIKSKCLNPKVSVTISDNSGKVLDQKIFEIETKSKVPSNWKLIMMIVVLIIVTVGLLMVYLKKKKNSDGNISPQVMMMFILLPIIFSLMPFNLAQAGQWDLGGGVTLDLTLDKQYGYSDYSPGNYNNNKLITVTSQFDFNGGSSAGYGLTGNVPGTSNSTKVFEIPSGSNSFTTPREQNLWGDTPYDGGQDEIPDYYVNFLITKPSGSQIAMEYFTVAIPDPMVNVTITDAVGNTINSVDMSDVVVVTWDTDNHTEYTETPSASRRTSCEGSFDNDLSYDFAPNQYNDFSGSTPDSGGLALRPQRPTTYTVTCVNRDSNNTNAGTCSGTYSVTTVVGQCVGQVGGAYPWNPPYNDDGASCEPVSKEACLSWYYHGCHWDPTVAETKTYACSAFNATSSADCTSHSGCTWQP